MPGHALPLGGEVEGRAVDIHQVYLATPCQQGRKVEIVAVARTQDADAALGAAEQGRYLAAVRGEAVPLRAAGCVEARLTVPAIRSNHADYSDCDLRCSVQGRPDGTESGQVSGVRPGRVPSNTGTFGNISRHGRRPNVWRPGTAQAGSAAS